jgi:alanine racemase
MIKKHLQWLEIDSKAFHKNIRALKNLAGSRQIAAAVKANAYGHGLPEILSLLKKEAVSYIALHSLEEAILARRCGWDRNILMVGYIALSELEATLEYNLEPTVYSTRVVSRLGKLAEKYRKKIHIHLKVETGTNRQGLEPAKIKDAVAALKKNRWLNLKGISTHFANIEDTTDHSFANGQLRLFNKTVLDVKKSGLKPKYRHTACSAALLLFDKTKFELVRPGISVYGLWPSKETYLSYRLMGGTNKILTPILSWYARIIQIKDVAANDFIGYGCTYRTSSKTRLAVLPVGYYDGYDRGLSNLSHVLIRGRRAPVRGRICMNMMMVDITDIPGVRREDPVLLLGHDGREKISADFLANLANTVNYEIVSRLNNKTPRIIV